MTVTVATVTFGASLDTLVSTPPCTGGTGLTRSAPAIPPLFPAARGGPSQPRSERGRVDGRLLRHPQGRRPDGAGHRCSPTRPSDPHAVRARTRCPRPNRARRRHAERAAQAHRRHGPSEHRNRKPTASSDRGNGHSAFTRDQRHHAHRDGDRGAVFVPAHPRDDAATGSGNPSADPNNILVRLRPGRTQRPRSTRSSDSSPASNGGVVAPVQRPAEIVNYRSMGTTQRCSVPHWAPRR